MKPFYLLREHCKTERLTQLSFGNTRRSWPSISFAERTISPVFISGRISLPMVVYLHIAPQNKNINIKEKREKS